MIAQLNKNYIKGRPYKVFSRLLSYLLFEGRPLTTKGRWINSLVFGNFKILAKIPAAKKVTKPIFILGTGRSGTTILGSLLSMHKHVGFLNEPKALWNFIYPFEDIIGNYSTDKAYYRLDENMLTPSVVKKAHRVYSFYLALSFSKRVVDKYPELIFRTRFVKGIFPDAKFIFLVRNGWDTCASIQSWSKRFGAHVNSEEQDWWGRNRRKWNLILDQLVKNDAELSPFFDEISKFTRQTDMAAVEWIITMKEGLKLINEGKDMLLVKYENIVEDNVTELNRILNYCELPPDHKLLTYAKQELVPAPAKSPFLLSPIIQPEFMRVMQRLNYN